MELMMVEANDLTRIENLENSEESEYAVMSMLMDPKILESVLDCVLDNNINLVKRTLLFKMLMTQIELSEHASGNINFSDSLK
jgi:hypothetical protein